jgi:hypothetical protein
MTIVLDILRLEIINPFLGGNICKKEVIHEEKMGTSHDWIHAGIPDIVCGGG